MLAKPSIDDAYQADIEYHEQQEARWETMADDAQKLGEFRKVALERMYQDYGLDEELVEHCMGPMYRRLLWFAGAGEVNHPYSGLEDGMYRYLDDYKAIQNRIAKWVDAQEKQVREEYIQRLREAT